MLMLGRRGLLGPCPLVRGLPHAPAEDVDVGLGSAQQGLAVAEVGGGGLRGELWGGGGGGGGGGVFFLVSVAAASRLSVAPNEKCEREKK